MGKRVLGVGPGSIEQLRKSASGAEYVEHIRFSECDPLPDKHPILDWDGKIETNVVVRSCTALTIDDVDQFDEIVVGVGKEELLASADNLIRALRPGGRILWEGYQISSPSSPMEPHNHKARSDRKTMLHVHNVQRCGGTGNFVHDLSKCFQEFNHVALCVNDPNGDKDWLNSVAPDMRPVYAPKLTEAFLEEIDPSVIVLHATAGKSVEGDWPYDWLFDSGRYTIAIHHVPTYPLFRSDLDIFVSKHVAGFYAKILDRCRERLIMPPCMDTDLYSSAPIDDGELSITSGGKHCSQLVDLSRKMSHLSWDFSPPGVIGGFPDYLRNFNCAVIWSGLEETWCRTLTECMAAGLLVVGHRSGAIPEQITHSKNGFLFDDESELQAILDDIPKMRGSERLEIREAGRRWATENAGFPTMKQMLYPKLMSAVIE